MNKSLSIRNRKRCESPDGFNHKLDSWSGSDWMVAVLGELGEAANVLKKLNRVRDGVPSNKESEEQLKEKLELELADAYIYLDLFCQSRGIDLSAAVNNAYQAKSEQIGYVEPTIVLQSHDVRDGRTEADFNRPVQVFDLEFIIGGYAANFKKLAELLPPSDRHQNASALTDWIIREFKTGQEMARVQNRRINKLSRQLDAANASKEIG